MIDFSRRRGKNNAVNNFIYFYIYIYIISFIFRILHKENEETRDRKFLPKGNPKKIKFSVKIAI